MLVAIITTGPCAVYRWLEVIVLPLTQKLWMTAVPVMEVSQL